MPLLFQPMKIKFLRKTTSILSACAVLLSACGAAGDFQTDQKPAAELSATISPTPTEIPLPEGYVEYLTQSGDTLPAVAAHFGVGLRDILHDGSLALDNLDEMRLLTKADQELGAAVVDAGSDSGISSQDVDNSGILFPGTRLFIKDNLELTTAPDLLFPDSDVVFSPSAIGFDLAAFAREQGGFLSEHSEIMTRGTTPSVEIVAELALGHSINPRILLTMMEYESGWVTRSPETDEEKRYPMGWLRTDRGGIYQQIGIVIRELKQGYYDWRAGTLTELIFPDGETLRLSPFLNAGTVGVMYALSKYHTYEEWDSAFYGSGSMVEVHEELFGDPWERAAGVEPLFEKGVEQPELHLPIPPNQVWNNTCGPHNAWGLSTLSPPAALDFGPPLDRSGCGFSRYWTTAAAAGKVVRVDNNGVVVIDLDMDGYEQTGWVLLYMHVANSGRVNLGDVLQMDDRVGHPSCQGGSSSGIHVHIARKYNGEWVLADGGIPFVLSGYRAYNGEKFCAGTLESGEHTITADPYGNYWTRTIRTDSDPKYFYTPTPRP